MVRTLVKCFVSCQLLCMLLALTSFNSSFIWTASYIWYMFHLVKAFSAWGYLVSRGYISDGVTAWHEMKLGYFYYITNILLGKTVWNENIKSRCSWIIIKNICIKYVIVIMIVGDICHHCFKSWISKLLACMIQGCIPNFKMFWWF